MEFDKDDQFFATAGVRRKIKIFEVESLLDVDGYNDENTLKNKFISKIKSNHSSNSIDKSLFEEDIDDFISKIQGVKGLESIEAKLSNMKETKIAKQINKLLIVRIITTAIFILTLFVFLYIFFDLSIFI